MKSLSFLFIAGSAIAPLMLAGALEGRVPAVAATPPPTPPPIGTPQAAQPNASEGPAAPVPSLPGATRAPSPSPPPNPRKGLDGVWEVQIQHPSGTDYTHFKVAQQGEALTGTYVDSRGKRYPLSGTVAGSDVRLIVTMPDGTTLLLEGRLDGTTDMVGELTRAGGEVPFTASYRPKEKWIENVNASPGGMGQPSGGYTPP
ncbi:MAG TPA: hypothetical protein VMT95_04660 [Candidatus Binatia bacterium]|nr:hypothetical protein [Candidatus Binatia bacterium]